MLPIDHRAAIRSMLRSIAARLPALPDKLVLRTVWPSAVQGDLWYPVHQPPMPARQRRSSRVSSNWRGLRIVGEDFLGFR
jgi:hypothetical protein